MKKITESNFRSDCGTIDINAQTPYDKGAEWDSCLDIKVTYNQTPGDYTFIHICNIDDFIKLLQEVRSEMRSDK